MKKLNVKNKMNKSALWNIWEIMIRNTSALLNYEMQKCNVVE